ncbi:O-antigen ligase family protein [Massilia cavernae]|uniref:O-antigen ligase family protein n=1 Tax=Massilia cavernae TaxID=2320864 RepID=A0A418Y818_9BURK|nr:O-antigen ligase family protein [Massilia cavernae]RJG27288.1 O-antigen ligase family protein [Massilia cavernae]
MNNSLLNRTPSKQAITAILMFLFPFLSLVTPFGVGLCSFLFLIAGVFVLRDGNSALRRHWPSLRWVILPFLLNFLFVLGCYLLRDHALGAVEKPVRMLLAVSALALVLAAKPDRKALWWGVIGGAAGALLLVGYQRVFLDMDRPGGLLNAITFGDIALSLALLALAATVDVRAHRQVVWPALGAVAGLVASIMTGTRGGWLGLALAALVFVAYGHVLRSWRSRVMVVSSFALVVATYFIPATGVQERVHQGVAEATVWFDGGSAFSNVGTRLELWKAAATMIEEAPLLGRGEADYLQALKEMVAAGQLDPVVLTLPHFHNESLQALVTGGVVGFAIWAGMMLAPFMFFAHALRERKASAQEFALALAGILLVTGYVGFGLTEVIFWSIKGSLFYALMVFLLMGLYLNAKESHLQGH